MAKPTHIVTDFNIDQYVDNGYEVGDFEAPFNQFDGKGVFARSMCTLPRPGWPDDFTELEINDAKGSYIQAAGSSQALTVEIRQKSGPKGYRQYVVGAKVPQNQSGNPSVRIGIGESETFVYPHEVFDARSAAEVFYLYYRGITLDQYSLRELLI